MTSGCMDIGIQIVAKTHFLTKLLKWFYLFFSKNQNKWQCLEFQILDFWTLKCLRKNCKCKPAIICEINEIFIYVLWFRFIQEVNSTRYNWLNQVHWKIQVLYFRFIKKWDRFRNLLEIFLKRSIANHRGLKSILILTRSTPMYRPRRRTASTGPTPCTGLGDAQQVLDQLLVLA